MQMANQDWTSVSWDNRGKSNKGESKAQRMQQQKGNVSTQKRAAGDNTTAKTANSAAFMGALDRCDQSQKHDKVSIDLKKRLQQERVNAGYRTQKALATACNLKSAIIAQYENGKAIPTGSVLQKIERALRQKNPQFVMGTLSKAQKHGKPTKN